MTKLNETHLSPTMIQALQAIRAGSGTVRKMPPNVRFHGCSCWEVEGVNGALFGTSTIQALVDRGYLMYTEWVNGKTKIWPVKAEIQEPHYDQ